MYDEIAQGILSELLPFVNNWPPGQSSSSSAACAAAVPAPVSLSESQPEEDALVVIAESFPVTQWTDNSSTAALTNTLTALTLAGVPATNTTTDEVLVSLRGLVVVSDAPAEAEVEFTMRPRNLLRPRLLCSFWRIRTVRRSCSKNISTR